MAPGKYLLKEASEESRLPTMIKEKISDVFLPIRTCESTSALTFFPIVLYKFNHIKIDFHL